MWNICSIGLFVCEHAKVIKTYRNSQRVYAQFSWGQLNLTQIAYVFILGIMVK